MKTYVQINFIAFWTISRTFYRLSARLLLLGDRSTRVSMKSEMDATVTQESSLIFTKQTAGRIVLGAAKNGG